MEGYKTVFSADEAELADSVARIRDRVKGLKAPRLYHAAFVLAALTQQRRIAWWSDWDEPLPVPIPFSEPRATVENVMWKAFGLPASLLQPGTPALAALRSPARVLVDPLYDGQQGYRLTVVRPTAPGETKKGNSIKLPLRDPSWVWGPHGLAAQVEPVEYNPVNTFGQQNGIRCGLPAAMARSEGDAAASYAIDRVACPHRDEAKCALNDDQCGAERSGRPRMQGKPRALVASRAGRDDTVLLPTAFDQLVAGARGPAGSPLPRAQDLATVTGWAAKGRGDRLNFLPLVELLGPLLPTLTEI